MMNGRLLTSLLLLAASGAAQTSLTLYRFAGYPDGNQPWGGVVVGAGGVLYGTTSKGGASHVGTVFSLTPPISAGGAWTETLLHNFTGSDGRDPLGGLVIGDGGVLYGTTYQGGSGTCGVYGCGAVFSLTPPASSGGTWTETVLYSFTGYPNDGSGPTAGLKIGAGGVLYGVTSQGDSSNFGTVFSLTPPATPAGAWAETVLHNFTGGTDGISPYAPLLIGDGGVLYGTTGYGGNGGSCVGCGTVFSLTPPASPGGTWIETLLHSFSAPPDGSDPTGLLFGGGGVLFGITGQGGMNNHGTVFSLTPPTSPTGAWKETVLYTFAGPPQDGASPELGMTVVGDVLYGSTFFGGPANHGTVFSLTPPASPGQSWGETVLHAFSGDTAYGVSPVGTLAAGKDGTLYGVTAYGGVAHAGIVFRLSH